MENIHQILDELRADNGSNHKLAVLKKHKDNELLQRILKLTHDKVLYNYGLSVKHWVSEGSDFYNYGSGMPNMNLFTALDILETEIATRKLTGNAARDEVAELLSNLAPDDATLLLRIIDRDLKIGCGRTSINKVWNDLVTKQIYMRCAVFTKELAAKKMNPKDSIVQLKADGTYREFVVSGGKVSAYSRSGEEYEYPVHFEIMQTWPEGHYFGELTVWRDGNVLPRSLGNGEINSLTPPHENIVFDCWDYVTPEEYANAAKKIKNKIPYGDRLKQLEEIVGNKLSSTPSNIKVIETHIVQSAKEAMEHCSRWMNEGLEGAIWKDSTSVFRDGTNQQQQKMKLEISAEFRITGFQEGTPGTVREKTFGAMLFENDEGTVKGKTSGFTDAQLADFNSRREELIGQIITVQFNDLSKARDNDYYALSHPRFVELRGDKTETDNLEKIMEQRKSAMELSE